MHVLPKTVVHSLPYIPPLLLGLGFILLFYFLQPPIDFRSQALNDANQYLKIYEAFRDDQLPASVSFPFHNRLLTPFLAACIGSGRPETDFFIVNSVYALIFVIALFHLFRALHIPGAYYYLSFLWLLHWLGPFRNNAADPLNTNTGVLMFQTLMLLMLLRQNYRLLLLIMPLAVLHKEVFLAWAVLYAGLMSAERFLETEPVPAWRSAILTAATCAIVKFSVQILFPPLETGRGALITMMIALRESFLHPIRLLRWAAAMFTGYGLFFIPIGLRLIRPWHLNRFQTSLLLFFTVNLLFGLLAGDDHTRLLYLGFPFLFTLLGSTTTGSAAQWLPAAVLSLPVMGLWSGVPVVPPEFTGLPQWAPEYGPWHVSAFWLSAGTIASAALVIVFHRKKPLSPFRTPRL